MPVSVRIRTCISNLHACTHTYMHFYNIHASLNLYADAIQIQYCVSVCIYTYMRVPD